MKKTTLGNSTFSVPLDFGGLRAFANAEDLKNIAVSKLGVPLGEAIARSLKSPGPYRIRMRLKGPIEIKLERAELEELLANVQIIPARSGSST